ncbi:hypothetical protein [Paraburkholderia sediminicola]|uniref:hypothetical protein n=1 Tax=Paraburkholderia sediminicola TaxID=458836 RepID=UPI0038BDED27
MKKLFGALIALYSAFALSATTVPVQLLNPTGSTSGQAIVSTGASTAPAWGGIGVNGIAAIAANTVLANATGSSAAPTAFAMPSCSASGNALNYTSGTGWTCATGYALLTGGTFSGAIVPSGGITGVTNGSAAAAGAIGQLLSASAGPIALTSGATPNNIVSLPLTAGDWDVWGMVQINPAGTTTMTVFEGGIGTSSSTQPSINTGTVILQDLAGGFGAGQAQIAALTPWPENVSTGTTVYCLITASFAVSTANGYCQIYARRRH